MKAAKVLQIDDDPFLLDMFAVKFAELGFRTVLFNNANGEIVERVHHVSPDIIVLDIIMPGRNGFETLKLLKADTRTQKIPVIILSNQGQKEDIRMGMELGAADYIITATATPASVAERIKKMLPPQEVFLWNPIATRDTSEDVIEEKKLIDATQYFVLKTKGGIAADGTVTLDRNGLDGLMPTKRNRDIFNHVLAQHEKDTAKINEVLGDGVLAQLLWAFGADPRNENVFYTSQEDATLMVRVGQFLDQLDKEYLAEKQT